MRRQGSYGVASLIVSMSLLAAGCAQGDDPAPGRPVTAADLAGLAPLDGDTPAAAAAAPAPEPPRRTGLAAYSGLGTWVDVYDWSATKGTGTPVGPGEVDRMAEAGVQTLYIQASFADSPVDILEPERLLPIIAAARARDISVVAWYLPTLVDPAADLRRLLAIAQLDVDAVAVDIEARQVGDVAERNRRLVQLSTDLRRALPDMTLGAIPFPPVVLEVVNPSFWPGFPWRELAPLYDVWLPMSYQSDRKVSSGYRDAYRYTAENIDRMRLALGQPDAPVHTIGGIANAMGGADVNDVLRAAAERNVLGGSLYDWTTTSPALWPYLQGLRWTGPGLPVAR